MDCGSSTSGVSSLSTRDASCVLEVALRGEAAYKTAISSKPEDIEQMHRGRKKAVHRAQRHAVIDWSILPVAEQPCSVELSDDK